MRADSRIQRAPRPESAEPPPTSWRPARSTPPCPRPRSAAACSRPWTPGRVQLNPPPADDCSVPLHGQMPQPFTVPADDRGPDPRDPGSGPVLRDDDACRPLGSPYVPHRHHWPLPSAGGIGVVCPYPHLAGVVCHSPHNPAGMTAATIAFCAPELAIRARCPRSWPPPGGPHQQSRQPPRERTVVAYVFAMVAYRRKMA